MLRLGIDPEKPYRATFICQDGLCCCNMALISFRLFRKNLGNLPDFFGQMVPPPPPLAKNFPYAYAWKWIKTKTHSYRISVKGRKHIKMKTMTENIAGVCTQIEFNLRHNVQSLFYCFERFSVNSRKRIKKVAWTRIDLYVFDDNENAFF